MFEIFSRLGRWMLTTLRGSEDGTESGALHVLKTDSAGRLQVSLLSADMSLADLADVDSELAPAAGDALRYDGQRWTAAAGEQGVVFFLACNAAYDVTNDRAIATGQDPYDIGLALAHGADTIVDYFWRAPTDGTVKASAVVYCSDFGDGDAWVDFAYQILSVGVALPSGLITPEWVGPGIQKNNRIQIVVNANIEVEANDIVRLYFRRLGTAINDTYEADIGFVGFLLEYQ